MNVDSIPLYVISLTTSTDRREWISKNLSDQSVSFKYWDAFDGKRLGLSTTLTYMRDRIGTPQANEPFYIGPGTNALILSNLALMRHALVQGYQHLHIMEDDNVILPSYVERLKEIVAELPDNYDLCSLDYCCQHMCKSTPHLSMGKSMCANDIIFSKKAMERLVGQATLGIPWDIIIMDQFNAWHHATEPLSYQLSSQGKVPTTLS